MKHFYYFSVLILLTANVHLKTNESYDDCYSDITEINTTLNDLNEWSTSIGSSFESLEESLEDYITTLNDPQIISYTTLSACIYPPWITLTLTTSAHSICITKEDDKYFVINNNDPNNDGIYYPIQEWDHCLWFNKKNVLMGYDKHGNIFVVDKNGTRTLQTNFNNAIKNRIKTELCCKKTCCKK